MTKPSADTPSGQPLGLPLNDQLGLVSEREIDEWADGFILKKAFNRPVAIQIATEAAKWGAERAAQRLAALPAPAPLSGEDATRLWHENHEAHKLIGAFELFAAGVLAAERAHGIAR